MIKALGTKREDHLRGEYFGTPFFPAHNVYVCGDIDCDVLFPVEDDRDTRCPRCGNKNTQSLTTLLSNRTDASFKEYVRYLRTLNTQQMSLPLEGGEQHG